MYVYMYLYIHIYIHIHTYTCVCACARIMSDFWQTALIWSTMACFWCEWYVLLQLKFTVATAHSQRMRLRKRNGQVSEHHWGDAAWRRGSTADNVATRYVCMCAYRRTADNVCGYEVCICANICIVCLHTYNVATNMCMYVCMYVHLRVLSYIQTRQTDP
jgi:hypothetical protein